MELLQAEIRRKRKILAESGRMEEDDLDEPGTKYIRQKEVLESASFDLLERQKELNVVRGENNKVKNDSEPALEMKKETEVVTDAHNETEAGQLWVQVSALDGNALDKRLRDAGEPIGPLNEAETETMKRKRRSASSRLQGDTQKPASKPAQVKTLYLTKKWKKRKKMLAYALILVRIPTVWEQRK